MSDDPYETLGVKRDATQEDIRKAYRKLAKDLHPDLNPGDKAAEEHFKKASSAYHILKDPKLRARFDRGEIDASGAERPEQHFYRQYAEADPSGRYHSTSGYRDFEDMSDLFSEMFRGRGGAGGFRTQGPDVYYHLEVDFLDAVNGAKRRVTMPDGKSLDLTIPAGTKDGVTLRLKDKGGEGPDGASRGDALVQITVRPHPIFRRESNDIVIELPITLDEAVLGGKVEVPTVSGRVTMTVPKGASSGDVLRLRGKGAKPHGRPAGDQRVTLKIVLPEKIDEELATFFETWRKRHRYDPRAKIRRSA